MHFRPRFWGFWKFLVFLRFLWNCWDGCFCFLLYAHGLHPYCIITMFYAYLDVCDWLLLLSVVRFRLGDPQDAHNFSRHLFMHTSFLFFSFPCYLVVRCSLSLSLSDRLRMAPKARKSTLARNPLGSGSSSFDPIPPLHVQFCDGKAQKDFLKNFIDFPSHFITSIIDVYQDMTTRDKLIFPSAITRILRHFSIYIPDSPYYTIMGATNDNSVQRSEAQLRPKRPWMETIDPAASVVPSTSASSSLAGGVTLEAIIA